MHSPTPNPSIPALPRCRLWRPTEAGPTVAAVSIDCDSRGRVAALLPAEPAHALPWAIPGVANLHSHAFQRAMAGLVERRMNPQDSFWTWRETMYRLAARFDPDSLREVAAQLYVEMLEAGYTRVCEFHYLHHRPDGAPYADPAAMSQALIEAARETGIGLTLLPVLYMSGGFDGRPLSARQARFGHSVDAYLRLLESPERRSRTAACVSAVPCTACARYHPRRCAKCWQRCRTTAASTSISPSRPARSRSAWRCAARVRSNGFTPTWMSTPAGPWCTPPT
jgi:formiminoglutamate deiminase